MPFTRTVTVRFDEADARGILFYGRLQELAHRVFEDFVVSELVAAWEDWFLAPEFIVPIRHAEATFHRPMRPGHGYRAELSVVKLGESSFEVRVRFFEADTGPEARAATDAPVLCAETRVSHVFADAARFRKIAIPSGLRARLEAHLASE
jgi:acyl-CoA thioester hydrolase/1,4-dihydroxy-2-naphthoyl-CoA hydrolase